MKLADEIAVEVGGLQHSQDKDAAWLALASVIIAAKLEPVTGVLNSIKDAADGVEEPSNYDNMPARWVTSADSALSAVSQASKTALAMLSEDEKG